MQRGQVQTFISLKPTNGTPTQACIRVLGMISFNSSVNGGAIGSGPFTRPFSVPIQEFRNQVNAVRTRDQARGP
jgi:hypothetical protein